MHHHHHYRSHHHHQQQRKRWRQPIAGKGSDPHFSFPFCFFFLFFGVRLSSPSAPLRFAPGVAVTAVGVVTAAAACSSSVSGSGVRPSMIAILRMSSFIFLQRCSVQSRRPRADESEATSLRRCSVQSRRPRADESEATTLRRCSVQSRRPRADESEATTLIHFSTHASHARARASRGVSGGVDRAHSPTVALAQVSILPLNSTNHCMWVDERGFVGVIKVLTFSPARSTRL
jgi:hypothetical protein